MSSPLILSFSTVFSLIGIVLVSIAFGTNNWHEYKIDRATLIQLTSSGAESLSNSRGSTAWLTKGISNSDIFFTRSFGLFRECFASDVPSGEEWATYLSPLGSQCLTIKDFQIPENKTVTERWTVQQRTRMHLVRTTVAFYIVGLAFLFFCLITGIAGCWRRSAALIVTTGVLLLFATLFLAASMAVWHGVDYLSREVINVEGSFQDWPQVVKDLTKIEYGWSYMVSWIGIGFVLISSIFMLAAYRSMKEEERDEMDKKRGGPYMVPNYYDKQALVPYAYSNGFSQGQGFPYPTPYGFGTYAGNPQAFAPYGYMTYGR